MKSIFLKRAFMVFLLSTSMSAHAGKDKDEGDDKDTTTYRTSLKLAGDYKIFKSREAKNAVPLFKCDKEIPPSGSVTLKQDDLEHLFLCNFMLYEGSSCHQYIISQEYNLPCSREKDEVSDRLTNFIVHQLPTEEIRLDLIGLPEDANPQYRAQVLDDPNPCCIFIQRVAEGELPFLELLISPYTCYSHETSEFSSPKHKSRAIGSVITNVKLILMKETQFNDAWRRREEISVKGLTDL